MRNILVVAAVFWLLFMNGFSYIKSFMGSNNIQNIPATVIKGANNITSGVEASQNTGRVALGTQRAAPAEVVVPQGMPVLPTVTPVMMAGAAPAVSSEEATRNAEIHALIVTPPTPVVYGTETCNSENAKFKGSKEVEKNGIPIGKVEAISCVSQAEVDEGLRIREYAMIANHQ